MRNILVIASFFVGTPLVLFLSIFYLSYLNTAKNGAVLGVISTGIAYAALPPTDNEFQQEVNEADSRVELVRQFLERYNSPLEPYAPDLVAAAERHNLDFRLLPAIAMQESTACKKIIIDSYNCWGWGIYGSKVTKFNNYPEAIETISKGLNEKYSTRGLITPQEVGKMYNPSNTNNWAENVTTFMDRMK